MNTKRLLLLALLTGLALPCYQPTAHAADHMNLEGNFPLQIEDAYPTAYRNREFLTSFKYELTREDEDRFEIAPQLAYGVFPNTELSVHVPFLLGESKRQRRH